MTQISFSPEIATGVFIGVFLIALLAFAVGMLMDIHTSDTIGQPKKD